jgi:hypothetical protein
VSKGGTRTLQPSSAALSAVASASSGKLSPLIGTITPRRSRGAAERPDATIDTDPATLATVLWHGRRLTEAVRSSEIEIEGSRPAVTRFLGLFPVPEPV